MEGGFAAVAYYLADTNELVVSFRGTDNPSFFGFPLVDAITGWPIGNGVYDGIQSQANLAFAFYNDLKALVSDPSSPAYSAEWCFTGHSLGGGLAGLVASTKGLPAYVCDSMPFTEAANNLYDDVSGPDAANHSYWSNLAYPDGVMNPPSFSQITSYAIEDEVNSNLRYGTPFVVAGRDAILTSGLDSQIIQQNEIRAGAVENIVDLHSQALLTIALHGGLQHSAQRVAGGEAIYHHLFDASLASRLGFSDAEFLRQHLAYSIDDDIVGLDSLFADMDVLGTIVQSFTPNAHLAALGKLAIIHASEIVSTGDSSLRLGLIDAVGGVANIALSGTIGAADLIHDFVQVSSSALQGEFFEIPTTTVSNLAVSMSGYGEEVHLASGGTMYFGTSYLDDIYGSEDDDVILSLGRDAAFYDTIRAGGGNDVIYASAGADTIHDGSGNDRAHGGSGNDTFHSGTGSDAMFGEADNDTFHLGEAEAGDVDYINGGAHTGTGDVVEVSVGATYRLDAAGAAAIRTQIVANGFAAPTGHGIGIEMAVGDAFVQGVEIIRASAEANELVGASKTPMYAGFAIGQGWDAGVLLDTDAAGHAAKEKIEELYVSKLAEEKAKRFRTFMLGKAAGSKKTDFAIEDIFPDKFYLECVNAAFGLAIKIDDLPLDGSDMVTKRVEQVLKTKYSMTGLDKRRVLAEMLNRFDNWKTASDLPAGTAAGAEKLFKAINGAFSA